MHFFIVQKIKASVFPVFIVYKAFFSPPMILKWGATTVVPSFCSVCTDVDINGGVTEIQPRVLCLEQNLAVW